MTFAQNATTTTKTGYYELKLSGNYPIHDIVQLHATLDDSILILRVPGAEGEIQMHKSVESDYYEGKDIRGILVQEPGINIRCKFFRDSLTGSDNLKLYNEDFLFTGELFKKGYPSNLNRINKHLSKSEMQEDILQLKRVAEYIHPAPFNFTTSEEFDSIYLNRLNFIQSYNEKDSLNINEFYSIVAPLVAQIGCGHAMVSLPTEYPANDKDEVLFPLPLYISGNKAFVSKLNGSEIPPGSEVISVNGGKMSKIISILKSCIPADALLESTRYYKLNSRFFHTLYKYCFGRVEKFTIETKISNSEKAVKHYLSGISSGRLNEYYPQQRDPDPVKRYLSLKFLPEYNASVLKIGSFGFYSDNSSFQKFIDSTFAGINERKIDNLIIDLRNNDGGDPFCSAYLFRYLITGPAEYFSKDVGSYYGPLTKPLEPFKNAFRGNLWILTDAGCMSSTTHLLALLKFYKIGKLAGSETAGNFKCNDNSKKFTLINSGIQVTLARKTYAVAVHGQPVDRGVIPDHSIDYSIDDILNGADRSLNFVLERIKLHQ